MKDQREIPIRDAPSALWFVPMKAFKQSGQVFILANIHIGIAYFVGDGSSITFDGTRLKVFLLKQEKEKIRNLLYSGSPEVHLTLVAPSDKNGPL